VLLLDRMRDTAHSAHAS